MNKDAQLGSSTPPTKRSLFSTIKSADRIFLLAVLLPTLLSILYYGALASDVYISESRFVVRSPERQTASPLGAFLKGTGFSRSPDDSYTVQDFMLSRDALKSLDNTLAVGKSFSNKDVDIFSRFAGLDWDDSFEALYRYYKKQVDVQHDASSSITTVVVRTFTPEGALRINEQLLDMAEKMVNELNARGRRDMILFASGEVAAAEEKSKAAAVALSSYRDQKGVIDPERQSTIQLQQIAKLQDELIAATSQLAQLQTFTKNNPQIPALQQRIKNLRQSIAEETARVAGGDRSLANKAAQYQRLSLDREFADKQLASALLSLEQARNDAQRQQLYLERIVQPNKPDVAMEPRRVRAILATLVLGIVTWGILSLLMAGICEHHD